MGRSFTVDWVYDGDTVRLRDQTGNKIICRLWGLDAPEVGQLGYHVSKRWLGETLRGGEWASGDEGREYHGRKLIRLRDSRGQELAELEIQAGMAVWYKRYAKGERHLERAENEARAAGRGIWREREPVAPWAWRWGVRERGKTRRQRGKRRDIIRLGGLKGPAGMRVCNDSGKKVTERLGKRVGI